MTNLPSKEEIGFQWRMKGGVMVSPLVMKTSHLYHTVAMIWHHVMPVEAELYQHKRYNFGSHYTDDYMHKAIYHLLRELVKRTDVEPIWATNIARMQDWLRKPNGKLRPSSD